MEAISTISERRSAVGDGGRLTCVALSMISTENGESGRRVTRTVVVMSRLDANVVEIGEGGEGTNIASISSSSKSKDWRVGKDSYSVKISASNHGTYGEIRTGEGISIVPEVQG